MERDQKERAEERNDNSAEKKTRRWCTNSGVLVHHSRLMLGSLISKDLLPAAWYACTELVYLVPYEWR